MRFHQTPVDLRIVALVASAFILSVTSSRPLSQGEKCEVHVPTKCKAEGFASSLAEFYKRLFYKRMFLPEEKRCYSKKTIDCVHGKCGVSRCECLPCWKGESCDASKHAPKFEQVIYDIQLPKDAKVGSTVTVVSAIDQDSKACQEESEHCACAEVTYKIEKGNDDGFFEINSKTGVLSVGKSLGTTEKKVFKLAISAFNKEDRSDDKTIAEANILLVHKERGSRKRRSVEVHHRSRRAIITGQSTLVPVLKPVVANVTYYNKGDEIKFALNLSHNASASSRNPVKTIQVTLKSKFLQPKASSVVALTGSVSISGSVTYNDTSAVFQVADLGASQELMVEFVGIVKDTIHPLANLYFTLEMTGKDSGETNDYPSEPHVSVPTLYAVFPKVTLQRTTISDLWVGSSTNYKMSINMPKLNFELLVELSTAINDFSFMMIHNVNIMGVGTNIGIGVNGNKSPTPSFHKSQNTDFHDRAVLDFGNLTVSDASSNNIIEIEFNVTILDHPSLANGSKHWVGAGMRSGYHMLWVGQEAVNILKDDPTLVGVFTTLNDTKTKRYFIGDVLQLTWEVTHNNNSYDDARDVSVTFSFSGLNFVSGTYASGGGSATSLTPNSHKNGTTVITEATLVQANNISGSLVLEVTQDITPLKELDIIMTLTYKNGKNKAKMPRDYKPNPPYVAGVPIFNLKVNSSSNTITIGSRVKFYFTTILVRMVSPLKMEVILPVNGTSPIMTVTSMKVISVGATIKDSATLATKKATLKSTVNDDSQPDRAVIDFGTVTNLNGASDDPGSQIKIEFDIIVNDHSNITNGSKHWVGVGVRGGERMMWIGEAALIADVPPNRRPVLSITCTCFAGAIQCQDNTTLEQGNTVEYNATVEHHPNSQGYAKDVKVTWMTPPYIKFKAGSAVHDSDVLNDNSKGVPQFEFNKGMKFVDKMSFSFVATLDPDKMMPPGKTGAFSPIQLSYASEMDGGKYAAPLVPVNYFFSIPETGSTPQLQTRTCTALPEVTNYAKGIALDKPNNILYICRPAADSLKASCFYTSDKGDSWRAVSQQVGYIIGLSGDNVYAIARNKCAYLHQSKRGGVWYAVAADVWTTAKTDAESNVKKIAESYSNIGDPTGEYQMTAGDGTVWGANKNGVYVKPSGGSSFELKAQWTCCSK